MRFVLFSALLWGVACPAFSQISGIVVDWKTRKPVIQAQLYLDDGVYRTREEVTDSLGQFVFTWPASTAYELTLKHIGYEDKKIFFKVPQSYKIHLDTIYMFPVPTLLQKVGLANKTIDLPPVIVKAFKPTISLRGDTLEFNAANFHTTENASILNLFQKLPGLSMDVDGNFYFQGVPIHELYIDGRPVFQNANDEIVDFKMISRLLPASIVDKVQVTSKKQMTGIRPPDPVKIINITTKAKIRKRINGEVGAGYATQNGYKVAATASRFADHSQLMATSTFDNVSSMTPPSSTDESMDMNTRFPGTTRDGKVALSAGFDAGKKAKFNFTYTRMEREGDLQEQQLRQNFLPDSSYFYKALSRKKNYIRTGMLGSNFKYNFNEKNTLSFRADFFQTQSDISSGNQYYTFPGNKPDTLSFGNFSNQDHRDNQRLFLNTEYNHQFISGGELRLNINYDFDHTNSRQHNYSMNFIPGAPLQDTINQMIRPVSSNYNLAFGVQLFKPVGKQFYFQLAYNYYSSHIGNNQLTCNFNQPTGKYELVDTSLTYRFHNRSLQQTFNASLNYHLGKFSASMGATYGLNSFESSGTFSTFNISQQYHFLSPVLNMSWTFTPMSNLRADLSTSPLMPINDYLLPVISLQNPLLVQLGNPAVKPGYSRRLSLDYFFSDTTGTTFSVGGFANFEYNSVSTSVYTDSVGRQISKPINVDGTRSLSPTLSFGKRFSKIGLTLNYRAFADLRRTLSLTEGLKNINHSFFLNHDLTLSWNYKKWLELSAAAQLNLRGNKYSLQNDAFYNFTNNRIFLKAAVFLPAGLEVGTAGMYTRNSGVPGSMTLVNGWISKLLFKEKKWLIKCYGFDLLNQSKTQMAVATPNFVDRTQSNSQEQYFMCSLTRYFK